MKISTKELRTHTKQMLDSVNRGEEVIITYRGRPRAKVIPFDEGSGTAEETELFGIWPDHEDQASLNLLISSPVGSRPYCVRIEPKNSPAAA